MGFMAAFGWASVMLCAGVYLRAKIALLRHMLVPASVIGGVLGFIFINICIYNQIELGMDTVMYANIVNELFTVSFISISLTNHPQEQDGKWKSIMQGALAMGLIWCLLYALTPIVAVGVLTVLGRTVDMPVIYGMLIQFAFCQGPGQAAAYGRIFEFYGWENASVVAITLAAIGFLAAFMIGIPIAKYGIKKGIAKHCGEINSQILRGYLKEEEQIECVIRDTTCNSNVETLAFHFALIGCCYILALAIARLFNHIPGFWGSSMSSMMFMNGMYAAYIIKWFIKKLKIEFMQENILQGKITGLTSDYLVICSFMAISVNIIHKWLIPILVVSLAIIIITFIICFYFGCRIGGDNDFERTLGIYGTCTGTVPSGISLIRLIDPNFKTTASIELGASNLIMFFSTPVYIIILACASGNITFSYAILGLFVCVIIYLISLKTTKSWGRKTYDWK